MKVEKILADLEAAKVLMSRWQDENISTLEREVVLSILQNVQSEIKGEETVVEEVIKHNSISEYESVVDEEVGEPMPVEQFQEPAIEIEPQEMPIEEYEEEEETMPDVEPEIEFQVLFGQSVPKELIDRFVKELFWRDEQFFANEVAKLAAQPTLDAALFYICEKYNWNARSEAAEQFTNILSRYSFE